MRIDDDVKREVLSRADIGEVIGTYVTLRKRGNDLVGLCPFHAEKTPSFHVHPDRGFFKCFGCGAGGDAIAFLRQHENLTFPEALRALAARVGVQVEAENPAQARVRGEKEAIYHANAVAQAFWHRVLVAAPHGAPGRAYAAARGLTRATIDAFGLGYAPEAWDALREELRREGVDAAVAIAAGLLKPGASTPYDVYRERLMIPTRATTGEIVAFGGRATGGNEPKYLNTAATPVHVKGSHLFALDVARRSAGKEDALLVAEGYLDAIALHQAGITNAVAALGTAFTPQQAKAVRRVAARAYLCYDADAAGRKAALDTIEALVAEGVTPWIVRIPEGKDPDAFVRARGAEAFRALLAEAQTATQFKLDAELDARGERKGDRAAQARWAEETLRRLSPREEWDRWRVYVAGRLDLAPDDLRKSRLLVSGPATAGAGAGRVNASRHVVPGAVEGPSWEREALAALVGEPSLIAAYAGRLSPERFPTPALRRIVERLLAAADSLVQPSDVLALFSEDDEGAAALAGVATAVEYGDTEARRAKLDAIVARFRRGDVERRYRELDALIDRLWTAGETVPEDVRDEHRQLATQLKG